MPRDNEFVPLDGPEILEAVVEEVRRTLEAHHNIFAKHLSYPRVDWTFALDLDFYHTQESIVTNGVIGNADAHVADVPTPVSIKQKRRVHAPDAVREELLGVKPRILEDRGESAQLLSGPQNDGMIRISRP